MKIEKVISASRIAAVFFAVVMAVGCAGRQVELGNGSGATVPAISAADLRPAFSSVRDYAAAVFSSPTSPRS